ncbi:MAG TPA: ABC transporter ATP-binding protein [Actinomycetales bacterium]|nr:ABC transporter ATP-binding protein [Actinomycetales bacterium]
MSLTEARPHSTAVGMGAQLVTRGLTKRFRGGQVAVDDLDLEVPAGAVYGFLGPNGSGKTTTIRMLLGLVAPTAGRSWLLGQPMPGAAASVLPRVGSLVEGPAFHPYLSGRDNLRRADAADRTAEASSSARRVDTALERVGLANAAGKRYRVYSLGMRQRLGLAAAMLRPRDLLVLDEPTNGLDPQGTREVRSLVRELAAEGTTVFVSTHLLAEVEQICSHVGVMSVGRLVAQGPLAEVTGATASRVRVHSRQPGDAAAVLHRLGLTGVAVEGDRAVADLGAAVPEQLVAALVRADVAVEQFVVDSPTLEDLFVALTGEGFDVER